MAQAPLVTGVSEGRGWTVAWAVDDEQHDVATKNRQRETEGGRASETGMAEAEARQVWWREALVPERVSVLIKGYGRIREESFRQRLTKKRTANSCCTTLCSATFVWYGAQVMYVLHLSDRRVFISFFFF